MKLRDLSKERREKNLKPKNHQHHTQKQLSTKKENQVKRKQAIINKNYGRK